MALFIHCFGLCKDFELQHSPLAKFMLCVCLVITPPPKSRGKKGRRKEYVTRIVYVAPIALLKTLHEKTQWGKTHQGKQSTIVDVRISLQDRLVIFKTTVMDYIFGAGLPLNLATL